MTFEEAKRAIADADGDDALRDALAAKLVGSHRGPAPAAAPSDPRWATTPLSEIHRCPQEFAPRYDGAIAWLHNSMARGWWLRGASPDGTAMAIKHCPWCGAELPPGPVPSP